ncbi:MAG TPA: 50S ribosomal protein L25 [Candidatus Binataceae bacterium]|nr:50S ribosomal protein L25 [Candidatus Binataceae bacterium]
METGELNCEARPVRPKGIKHSLRNQGRVPAVLYGPTSKPAALSLAVSELKARIAAASHVRIVRLKSPSAELDGRHVIFKSVQRAPVSGEILHADLYEVDLNRAIRVQIALKFTGKAAGVAEGGILQPLVRAVEVECLPLEIPESIEVDVTALGIHDVIHVSTLIFTGNVKPIFDSDYAVVSVLPPTVAEIAVPVAAAVEGAAVEGAPAAEGAAAPGAEAAGKEGAAAAPAPAGGKKGVAATKKAEPAAKK